MSAPFRQFALSFQPVIVGFFSGLLGHEIRHPQVHGPQCDRALTKDLPSFSAALGVAGGRTHGILNSIAKAAEGR
jgi:hypothetical protein